MKIKYLFSLFQTLRIPGIFSILADWKGVIRFHFLYAAVDSGLLDAVKTPCSREALIERMGVRNTEILDALLKVGVSVKELDCKNGQYRIRGKRSRAMIGGHGDSLSALVQANVTYYNRSYRYAAARMNGFPLGEDLGQVGDIVARFSKLTDPVMTTFISEIVTGKGGLKILDVGCGSGLVLKRISGLNPRATGLGVEKDEDAAGQAVENIHQWELGDRFEIIKGDLHDLPPRHDDFDLITMINVVYYFPVENRTDIFRSLRAKLSRGGSLVIVMNMEGNDSDAAAANLNLVNASLKGVTPLPDSSTLEQQLKQSGFSDVKITELMPGSSFIGMRAR